LCEPLSFKGRKGSGLPGGRDASADKALQPRYDFEKYLYTYRVWGRAVYNPDGGAEYLSRFLGRRFGRAAADIAATLNSAGSILPLITTAHCPSAANNNYWPEIYTNMPIVDPKRGHPYGDTMSPKRFSAVSSLDPEFFSRMDDFAEELLSGGVTARYSPARVALWLDDAATRADAALSVATAKITDRRSAEFRRLAADATIQAGLGRFFAAKFRAGTLFAIYERSGDPAALAAALKFYREARKHWAALAETGKRAYRSDITFGYERQLRGSWADRLPAIDIDIADMEKLLATPAAASQRNFDQKVVAHAIAEASGESLSASEPLPHCIHAPATSFTRGKPIAIDLSLNENGAASKLARIRLRYRRVNQADVWQVADMRATGGDFHAIIPGDYTDSPFAIQYHFELHPAEADRPWLYPGLFSKATSQPYFVIRQRNA